MLHRHVCDQRGGGKEKVRLWREEGRGVPVSTTACCGVCRTGRKRSLVHGTLTLSLPTLPPALSGKWRASRASGLSLRSARRRSPCQMPKVSESRVSPSMKWERSLARSRARRDSSIREEE
eukprot:scaffold19271_cov28-Tisochrysis_lutea.AAC.1